MDEYMSNLSFGQPQFKNYSPALTVRDVKSPNSRSKRVMGYKTGRIHQFLSDYESGYYYLLEWADNVIDIREQFPLDIKETVAISDSIGIKHPSYKGNNITMTTDFVITLKPGNTIARTVKSSIDLENKRILEKFSIEQEYWNRRDVDWGIVTDKELNKTFIQNIKFFLSYKGFIDNENINMSIVNMLISEISSYNCKLKDVLTASDESYDLVTGYSLNIFKSLVADKKLQVDMQKKFSTSMYCNEIKIAGAL